MEPGFSKPWPEALNALTGSQVMDASSLMAYFRPLETWLKEANQLSKEWYFKNKLCMLVLVGKKVFN